MSYVYWLVGFIMYSYGIPAAMNAYDEFFEVSIKKRYKILFGFGWPIVLVMCILTTVIGVLLMNLSDCYLVHFKKDN